MLSKMILPLSPQAFMRLQKIILFLSFMLSQSLFAQQGGKIGDWFTYLPKREGSWVTQSTDNIYYSTGRSIVVFDKTDLSYSEISRMDGLTETLISKLRYDDFNKQLFVLYQSGGIDILHEDGSVTYIGDIRNNANIIGRKQINDLYILNENTGYLSTDFGIVEWDLKSLDFRFTTFTPFPVNNVRASNSTLFAATEDGLFYIPLADQNKINFSRWQLLSGNNGLPASYTAAVVEVFNGEVYVGINDVVYKSGSNLLFSRLNITIGQQFDLIFLSSEGTHLLIGFRDQEFSSKIFAMNAQGTFLDAGGGCPNRVLYGIEDQSQRIWFADIWRTFRFTTSGINAGCRMLEFDSPFSYTNSQIEILGDKVLFASGGASIDNFAQLSNRNGIYVLENGSWVNVTGAFINEIDQKDFLNFVSVAGDPDKNKFYAASFYNGIMTFDFDENKVELLGADKIPITDRVSFVTFDKKKQLWGTAYLSGRPIIARTEDGNWFSFSPPIANKAIAKIAVDDNNYKWFTVNGNPGGVLVLDEGEKINDPTDDRYKYFDQSNSVLTGGTIFSIKTDIDGAVWVGTNQGPVVFDCDPFDENCQGGLIKVLQDSIPAILLETEDVLAIEFDGGNRKWFGTRNGIFVQSADGLQQELRFTMENSVLLDNTITALKFDGKTGLMYIGTAQGMQAYQTETQAAQRRHSSDVYAFPNPVRPEYSGPISIRGLGRDANVKITDLDGRLVYETDALGGQATWDGKDYTGAKAPPGVYLVFSSSQVDFETQDAYVIKILIMN